ncbi:MAG TPA: FHA domain-containing protein [Tepidisphaeraceae bacterium]|nr:FHA domain-containing protein [Tepidisphaeraceae bacterium]
MSDNKITINWDDLQTRRVDNRLREQQAMDRNRSYAQMRDDALPTACASPRGSIWNNAIFTMAFFGLLGGLLAWGTSLLVQSDSIKPRLGALLHYDPNARQESAKLIAEMQNIEMGHETGHFDTGQMNAALDDLRATGSNNPYFMLAIDPKLNEKQRTAKLMEVENDERFPIFVLNVAAYGLCGMMIAMCLSIAEPLTGRKLRAAVVYGSAGAALGVLGGVAAALLTDRISAWAGALSRGQEDWVRSLAMHAAAWGTLGLFLGLGSGLLLRSTRKLLIGLAGGLLGGLIGGALVDPIQSLSHNPRISQLVALLAIGLVAGLASGWIEDVAKNGWLKVVTGIIAGKQFILYRNPTYIGSSPDCQIYLFKDPQVGKRHAAIHLLPTGIEIEDLPLGANTRVNGKPVKRARIKNGDKIEIGATEFRFQEKRPAAGH